MQNTNPQTQQASDTQPTTSQTNTSTPTNDQHQDEPTQHLFTDLDWQTEEEPPYPASNRPQHQQLYHLMTVTKHMLIGYYPHDTHTLGTPDAHYVAWAPLTSESRTTFH